MKELEVSVRERKNEDLKVIQRENEELKEVLSDVQVDLESKRAVSLQVVVYIQKLLWHNAR